MQPLGNIQFAVDGAPVEIGKLMTYKGFMYSGLPNLASVFGYANASWTLRSDLICERVCRLIGHLERKGYVQCVPRSNDPEVTAEPWVDFSSGYFQRAAGRFQARARASPGGRNRTTSRDILRCASAQSKTACWNYPRGRADPGASIPTAA